MLLLATIPQLSVHGSLLAGRSRVLMRTRYRSSDDLTTPRKGAVMSTQGDADRDLSCIGREFAGWHPWISSGGRWWATRKGRLPADPPEWWAMTVSADDAPGLREQIRFQVTCAASAGVR